MIGTEEVQPVRVVDIFKCPPLRVVQGSAFFRTTRKSAKVARSLSDKLFNGGRNMAGGSGHTLRLLGGLPFFNFLNDFAYNTFKISPFGNLLKLSSQFRAEIEPYLLFFKRSTSLPAFFSL